MTPTEAIQEMLARSGISKYALSKALGKSHAYIDSTLRQGSDIGASKLAEMARIMGFDLVISGDGEPIEITSRETSNDEPEEVRKGKKRSANV